jgi:peptidoglycan/xylan/chitin deacetylase (PgdA/CDA1 family)
MRQRHVHSGWVQNRRSRRRYAYVWLLLGIPLLMLLVSPPHTISDEHAPASNVPANNVPASQAEPEPPHPTPADDTAHPAPNAALQTEHPQGSGVSVGYGGVWGMLAQVAWAGVPFNAQLLAPGMRNRCEPFAKVAQTGGQARASAELATALLHQHQHQPGGQTSSHNNRGEELPSHQVGGYAPAPTTPLPPPPVEPQRLPDVALVPTPLPHSPEISPGTQYRQKHGGGHNHHALASTGAVSATRTIPVLMYHYVRDVDAELDPVGYRLSVSPATFAAQLEWLSQEGYTPVRMDRAAACLRGEQQCPPQAIVLTFDDGYADAYTHALPLLQEYGFVATFYIITSYVGTEGYMGWDELRAMRDAGMDIGAHSMTHPDLTALSQSQAYDQVASSREQLEDTLQVPVTSFCYPGGKFDTATRSLVVDAGYTSAVTTMQHADQSDLYTLPRIRVNGEASLDGFATVVLAYTVTQ